LEGIDRSNLKKILFITSHRKDRAPNQRFRFEQYFSFLNENGFECTLSPLIATKDEDRLFYSKGNYLRKIPLGILLAWRRLKDVWRADQFDFVFIAREAFIMGSTFFERRLARSKAKIIFDFDDAIWMDVVSTNNRFFSWLKDGSKTARIIQLSDLVFAGNEYLAAYARTQNNKIAIIPTTIDTEIYLPIHHPDKENIVIGWSGSVSTIEHFQYAIPALMRIKEKYGDRVKIKVIGDQNYRNNDLGIQGLPWKMETELDDLHSIDIGIMPLPDNEWTWGKCGLKGLQYMALEIPAIMSPVGVNREIIVDGMNGFLADTTEEWITKLSALIEDKQLRIKIGKAGRRTVVEKYSVISQRENYLRHFQLLGG
jgi:glycosyltransferase involved in cell wall biosynthesis